MILKIRDSIVKHRLIGRGDTILVAVSGGADSVSLLHALYSLAPSLGIRLVVAHLNHRIRGKAADLDAEFVWKLATSLGLRFIAERINVPALAKRGKISMEMAAREARYDFLAGAARRIRADAVATAHTADDQAETVLLKLCRGAGARGLGGMARKAGIDGLMIVRPMLGVSRKEIESFLKRNGLHWREDRSNRDVSYLRNRVRHEIIPMLQKKLNPDLKAALLRTAEILSEEDAWLESLSAKLLSAASSDSRILKIPLLSRCPVAAIRRILRMWLAKCGVPVESIDFDAIARIEHLMRGAKGTVSIELSGGWVVNRQYDKLTLVERTSSVRRCSFRKKLKVPGTTLLPYPGLKIVAEHTCGIVKDKPLGPGRLPARATVSAAAVGKSPIIVRSWKPGDRMTPFGMRGSKKLQDIFVDEKVPVAERNFVPILECRGRIIWIPGYRIASGWEVKSPSDKVIKLSVA